MLNSHNLRMARRYGAFRHKMPAMPSVALLLLLWLSMVAFMCLMPWQASSAQIKGIVETASWYGGKEDKTDPFEHTITANGHKFNEYALTAASWQYPFGTRLKVTNVDNGKSVYVTVDDRGPGKKLLVRGRVIDLTKGAFARIAALETGVIRIRIEKV